MSDPGDDLKATAESIHRDAELLQELEEEKIGLDPSDPRSEELSARVEELTRRLATEGRAQRELAEET